MLFCVGKCSAQKFGTDSVNRVGSENIKHFVQFHGNSTFQVFRIFEKFMLGSCSFSRVMTRRNSRVYKEYYGVDPFYPNWAVEEA